LAITFMWRCVFLSLAPPHQPHPSLMCVHYCMYDVWNGFWNVSCIQRTTSNTQLRLKTQWFTDSMETTNFSTGSGATHWLWLHISSAKNCFFSLLLHILLFGDTISWHLYCLVNFLRVKLGGFGRLEGKTLLFLSHCYLTVSLLFQ
jgi:hypothetical protein